MEKDAEALAKLNSEINDAENRGDRAWLQGVLAPRFALHRADPQQTVDDQVAFIQKAQPGGDRQIEIIQPIDVYNNRAVVKCVVTTGGKRFHNLRLFVRRDDQWKLLAWANEPE
jgi:Putative lumazine-binding